MKQINWIALSLMVLIFSSLSLSVQAEDYNSNDTDLNTLIEDYNTNITDLNIGEDFNANIGIEDYNTSYDENYVGPNHRGMIGVEDVNLIIDPEFRYLQRTTEDILESSVIGVPGSGGVRDLTISSESGILTIDDSGVIATGTKPIEVYLDNLYIRNTLTGQAEKYDLKILPKTALEIAKTKLGYQIAEIEDQEEPTLEVDVLEETAFYKARMTKKYNLFGFIPLNAEVSTIIDAVDGTASDIESPWWTIFATE
ncbi:MAG: hypothetical protein ABH821_01370 [archaeon]